MCSCSPTGSFVCSLSLPISAVACSCVPKRRNPYAAALSTCAANLLTRRVCYTDELAEYEDYPSKSRRNLARMNSVPA